MLGQANPCSVSWSFLRVVRQLLCFMSFHFVRELSNVDIG